jgi:hypothetical protein
MISGWLDLLTVEEYYISQAHLVDGLDWARTIVEHEHKWGVINGRSERTLKRIQAKAIDRIVSCLNHLECIKAHKRRVNYLNFGFETHLDAAVLPLAIALYVIGVFLKKIPKVRDWFIPWILLALSIVAANFLLGCNVSSAIQGILACGIAVLGNQLYKQTQIGLSVVHDDSEKSK